MPCSRINLPGGGVAIVKHATPRRPRCNWCGVATATQLCDAVIARTLGGEPITCDSPVCLQCAQHDEQRDLDLCPKHADQAR